jgi:hypothetical protein
LVVLLPILVLGIVCVFCFVGCDAGGLGGGFPLPPPFTRYSGLTVLGTQSLAAYWPLDEGAGMDSSPAHDRSKKNNPPLNGKYVDPNTLNVWPFSPPQIYPWPASPPIANTPLIDIHSAGVAMPRLDLGQAGLVFGDSLQPANVPGTLTTCARVEGCYVEVPFDSRWNPPTSFTLEAWVRVDWQNTDPPAWRAVLDGRAQDPICKGFAIVAKVDEKQPPPPAPPTYHWAAIVGNGNTGFPGFTILRDESSPSIALKPNPSPPESPPADRAVYLAVTFDALNNTLTLFVNDQTPVSMNSMNSPNLPTPLYVPNTSSPLYIGAGAPYVPKRMVANDVTGGPLFPFVGAIQDVAIYNKALSSTDIQSHFKNGLGIP